MSKSNEWVNGKVYSILVNRSGVQISRDGVIPGQDEQDVVLLRLGAAWHTERTWEYAHEMALERSQQGRW